MRKIFTILMAMTMLLLGSQVLALNIDVYEASNTTGINNWISSLGGDINVLEDFENAALGWHDSYLSDVGTFTAGDLPGTGATSYNADNDLDSNNPYFEIRNQGWYGRGNQTEGGSKYLDSADITGLTLELNVSVTNLFFYLQDPSDVNATTTVGSDAASYSFNNESNGSLWFIGISSDSDLASIIWSTTNTNDGYGLDDFSTVNPVPEPATILLLGSGLVGLAGFRRKKSKK